MAEGDIFHLFDIGSGREGLFAACEDNGTNGVVIVVFLQGVVEFAEEGGGEGVECSRAVKRDCAVAIVSATSAMEAGDGRADSREDALSPTPGFGAEMSRFS